MSDCNATLTTVTATDDVVGLPVYLPTPTGNRKVFFAADIPDGMAVVRDCDRLMRLDVTTLTCVSPHPHGPVHRWARGDEGAEGKGAVWTDDVPGAASHADNTPPADGCPHCRSACNADHERFTGCYECDQCSPPADECPNSLCNNGREPYPNSIGPGGTRACTVCGGTGDRPAVTDAEFQAAYAAWRDSNVESIAEAPVAIMAALEAAAATRKEARP